MDKENVQRIYLTISKEDAYKKIEERIKLGKDMLGSKVNCNRDIGELNNKKKRWTDFNVEMLKRIFNNDTISNEYKDTSGSMRVIPFDPYSSGTGLRIKLENITNDLKAKINKLESINDRLELFVKDDNTNQYKEIDDADLLWDLIHPEIVKISKERFKANHFADSVEAAFKEVNKVVKTIVKQRTGEEYDGAKLMNKALSLQNPIICLDDLSNESGQNIQKGYLQIFSGSMTGIRNPKAHDNINIDRKQAIHFLFLASLLMFKIDNRIK